FGDPGAPSPGVEHIRSPSGASGGGADGGARTQGCWRNRASKQGGATRATVPRAARGGAARRGRRRGGAGGGARPCPGGSGGGGGGGGTYGGFPGEGRVGSIRSG